MNNYPARTASLREAADVLRTYRRAARENNKPSRRHCNLNAGLAELRGRQNTEKSSFGFSKLSQNARKSDPEPPATRQKKSNMRKKRPPNAQEASKSEKKMPKSEK